MWVEVRREWALRGGVCFSWRGEPLVKAGGAPGMLSDSCLHPACALVPGGRGQSVVCTALQMKEAGLYPTFGVTRGEKAKSLGTARSDLGQQCAATMGKEAG